MGSTQRNMKFLALSLMTLTLANRAVAEDHVAEAQCYKMVSDIVYRHGHEMDDYMQERCRLDDKDQTL